MMIRSPQDVEYLARMGESLLPPGTWIAPIPARATLCGLRAEVDEVVRALHRELPTVVEHDVARIVLAYISGPYQDAVDGAARGDGDKAQTVHARRARTMYEKLAWVVASRLPRRAVEDMYQEIARALRDPRPRTGDAPPPDAVRLGLAIFTLVWKAKHRNYPQDNMYVDTSEADRVHPVWLAQIQARYRPDPGAGEASDESETGPVTAVRN
eukprot:jgi/Tetstr1/454049/TSEL_040968.t1